MADEARTGTGDPRRTLELLWGVHERATRGPKPALDVERVVRAAVELADADGLPAVSMRKVAERLGVGTMSLYRYVPGKGELLDLMFDRVVGEEEVEVEPSDAGWRERMTSAARASFGTFMRHPWLLDIVAGNRPPLGPNVMDSYERWLALVHASGLEPVQTQAAVELISTYVSGAARSAVHTAQAEAKTGVSDEQWWEQRADFWDEYFSSERFPTITATYTSGAYTAPVDQFEFGLARVLDGIETLLGRRSI